MNDVTLLLNEKNHGAVLINGEKGHTGEMVFGINSGDVLVYHTEVSKKAQGRGFAKKLLNALVAYARENQLKVVPICRFVKAQFERNPDSYKDVWSSPVSA